MRHAWPFPFRASAAHASRPPRCGSPQHLQRSPAGVQGSQRGAKTQARHGTTPKAIKGNGKGSRAQPRAWRRTADNGGTIGSGSVFSGKVHCGSRVKALRCASPAARRWRGLDSARRPIAKENTPMFKTLLRYKCTQCARTVNGSNIFVRITTAVGAKLQYRFCSPGCARDWWGLPK